MGDIKPTVIAEGMSFMGTSLMRGVGREKRKGRSLVFGLRAVLLASMFALFLGLSSSNSPSMGATVVPSATGTGRVILSATSSPDWTINSSGWVVKRRGEGSSVGSRVGNPTPQEEEEEALGCEDVKDQPAELQCAFVHEHCEDFEEGLINYATMRYCTFANPSVSWVAVALQVLLVLYLFTVLGLVADDYLAPTLTHIADSLNMSENVAGCTLVALANGAPDLFSAFAAVKHGVASVGMGALIGAGMFVVSCVVGSVAITAPFHLTRRPFLRDTCFYLTAVLWGGLAFYDCRIYLFQAVLFAAFYGLYVAVVFFSRSVNLKLRAWKRKRAEEVGGNDDSAVLLRGGGGSIVGLDGIPLGLDLHNPYAEGEEEDEESDLDAVFSAGQLNGILRHAFLGTRGSPFAWVAGEEDIHAASSNPLRRLAATFGAVMKHAGMYDMGFGEKVLFFVNLPIHIVCALTVPPCEEEDYNRTLCVLYPSTLPVFLAFLFGMHDPLVLGIPLALWIIAAGIPASVLLAKFLDPKKRPGVAKAIFPPVAFIAGVGWVYLAANELVNVLSLLGIVASIPGSLLGLTFLALGNSAADFVAGVTLAKQGFPGIAVGACFGSPLLNLLLGVGGSMIYAISLGGRPFLLVPDVTITISVMFLSTSLVFTMVYLSTHNYSSTPLYGYCLIALYVMFIVTCVIVSFV